MYTIIPEQFTVTSFDDFFDQYCQILGLTYDRLMELKDEWDDGTHQLNSTDDFNDGEFPCHVWTNSDGQIHRNSTFNVAGNEITKPAMIYPDGYVIWFQNNKTHCDNGIANIAYDPNTHKILNLTFMLNDHTHNDYVCAYVNRDHRDMCVRKTASHYIHGHCHGQQVVVDYNNEKFIEQYDHNKLVNSIETPNDEFNKSLENMLYELSLSPYVNMYTEQKYTLELPNVLI